jgi:two-component sensor histidine kinase
VNPYTPPASQSNGSERLLMREFAHRLTNELTTAVGLIDVASVRLRTKGAQQTLQAIRDSLTGFARVHQALQPPVIRHLMDARPYLRRLCDAIRAAKLQQRGIELRYADQPLRMDSEKCWKLGMIVFELITNSVKHAFGDGAGTIVVEVSCVEGIVRCRVADDGSSRDSLIEPGMGLSIADALARELTGYLDQRIDPRGSISTVTFPRL